MVLVVLGLFVAAVWRASEIRSVQLRTSSRPGVALPDRPLPVRLRRTWQTTDTLAAGAPLWEDVVVTFSERTVTGRDARTGAARWSYTRSDRRTCAVLEENGVVVAAFARDGNCDELTGLDAVSGQRRWVRTAFGDGAVAASAIPGQVLLVTAGATNLIEPTGGLDWWYQAQPAGCRIRSAVLGTTGVLVASACTGGKDTLSLRGVNSKQPDWSVPLGGRTPLLAADGVVVLSADGRSVQLLGAKGRPTVTTRLPSAVRPPVQPGGTEIAGTTIQVMSVGGGVLALRARTGERLWGQPLGRLPADATAGLLVAADGTLQVVSARAGRVTRQLPAPGLRAGDRVAQVGAGIVAGHTGGTAVFG